MSTVLQSASPVGETAAVDPPFKKTSRLTTGARFGDYLIEGEIARGGMGVVYRATQVSLNRPVALKMILSARLAGEEQVRRFRSEAEAAARFDHPGIVPVHEVGQVGGQHFFSMGLVEGGSLSRLTADGPLAPRKAAELVRSIAAAVQYAHSRNIVHRDLKPDNVLLDADGQPKITDFGLAKDLGSKGSGMTASHAVMGTPSYMAPEQALGRTAEVGPLADVYALGGILYYLLTDQPPFQGTSLPDTLRQVVEQEPTAPQKLNPQVDRNLQTIVLKCLHKDMNRRYTSAGELVEELERWLDNRPILARPVSLRERVWLWCRRRPYAASTVVTLLVAVAATGIAFERNSQRLRAEGLVESLLEADVTRVPELIDQLEDTEQWSAELLRTAANSKAESPESRRRQLHARLALVADDPQHVESLVESLLSGPWSYVAVIRDQLPVTDAVKEQLWTELRNDSADKDRRLKAAMALAPAVDSADSWSDSDRQFVVDHLLASNPEFHPAIRAALRPRRSDFLPLVEQRFQDPAASEAVQQSTTAALVDWAGDQPERLTEAVTWARPTQWADLLAAWQSAKGSSDLDRLLTLADQQPDESLSSNDRITLGKRRANAAIALALAGNLNGILSVMQVDDDPEALSQFAARCLGYGVELDAVLVCFDQVEQQRAGLSAAELQQANRALYGLLLSLGEYELDAVPSERREALITQLSDWYADDPSSTIHGATGWLLRRWGQAELVQKVDQTPLAYSPGREWYTVEVRPAKDRLGRAVEATQPLCFTFVVFEPGEYELGSPADEAERDDDETQHRVRITRPFAVLNREVSRGEFELFGTPFSGHERKSATPRYPINGPNWFDTVRFSRWLTKQAGLSEADQSYPPPADLDPPLKRYPTHSGDPEPREVPLNLKGSGFRLPTEWEWELACRGGMRTAYAFGGDPELLRRYGWFSSNSGKLAQVCGELRPNFRGLSDMHGNVSEWCHNGYGSDPIGPAIGTYRVNRGGGWNNNAPGCRSSNRDWHYPSNRSSGVGFRLTAVPSSK